jgi:hypothetical protein
MDALIVATQLQVGRSLAENQARDRRPIRRLDSAPLCSADCRDQLGRRAGGDEQQA